MSKYSLLGINIHPGVTHNEKNILKVSSKKEIFYDIFQCSFNGTNILVEKIGEFENKPLVEFKLKKDEKVLNCQAILEVGKEDNLFLYEKVKTPIKKVKVITEKTKKIVNEKVNKKAIEDRKKKIEENKSMIIDSMANEAIKLLDEKQKLDQVKRVEEAKRIEEAEKLKAKKLLEEKLLKEKLDADIKKMEEQVKIIEEEERIEKEKIRLNEERIEKEKIRLLEEERILKEERIRNTPFYTDGNAYAIDVDAKYKYIKITNGTTGAEKIFKSKGVPRKVVLNKNLLSYHNIINAETDLNYTIDIETEEIIAEKYIEPEIMGDGALENKLLINTTINILYARIGVSGTGGVFVPKITNPYTGITSTNVIEDEMPAKLKHILLPYYNSNPDLYDTNVTVNDFLNVSTSSTGYAPTSGISPNDNSIALGGLDMNDPPVAPWGTVNNVINIMFQDEADGRGVGVRAEFDEFGGQAGTGTWRGSLQFLKDNLDKKDNNAAIFFTVASGDTHADEWNEMVQSIETSYVGTSREFKTDFNYDVAFDGDASYYANLIFNAILRIQRNFRNPDGRKI